MKHPYGALKTFEEMRDLYGKNIFLCAPRNWADRKVRLIPGNVAGLTLMRIRLADPSTGFYWTIFTEETNYGGYFSQGFGAAYDFSSRWDADTGFIFNNYWHAYAFGLTQTPIHGNP